MKIESREHQRKPNDNEINTMVDTPNQQQLLVTIFSCLLLCNGSWGFPVSRPASFHNKQPLFFSSSSSPAFGLYEVQEQMLIQRGELEESLMVDNNSELQVTNKPKRTGGGRGFGGGSSSSALQTFKLEAKSHAATLKRNGVVRLDDVLNEETLSKLKKYVHQRRNASMPQDPTSAPPVNRFADVLLRHNRCDLLLPLGEPIVSAAVYNALHQSVVAETIARYVGKDAVLHELSCMISDPGSQRQVIHPDTPQKDKGNKPTLVTCFIALQDISLEMGPTLFLKGTHTEKAHTLFLDESEKGKLLATSPAVLATLSAGSAALFDSRILHTGTANRSSSSARAICYLSFRSSQHPNTGNPPSIRSELLLQDKQLTLPNLMEELKRIQEQGKENPWERDADE